MFVSEKIRHVATRSEFLSWTSNVGENGFCNLTRVSGFIVDNDNECITFFLPEGLFKLIEPGLLPGSNISLVTVSVKDFESYQVKGSYIGHCKCTEENVDHYRLRVLKVIDIITGMGLNGHAILGFLLEQPSVAVTFRCKENYLQTPKPGTGTKLTD